jgi:hypothetical protein
LFGVGEREVMRASAANLTHSKPSTSKSARKEDGRGSRDSHRNGRSRHGKDRTSDSDDEDRTESSGRRGRRQESRHGIRMRRRGSLVRMSECPEWSLVVDLDVV